MMISMQEKSIQDIQRNFEPALGNSYFLDHMEAMVSLVGNAEQ
jgi:hypothetical protein